MSDMECSQKRIPVCKVTNFVAYTLSGVHKHSIVDSHYLLQPDGTLLGYMRTKMIYNMLENRWEIWDIVKENLAAHMNETRGFPLGKTLR